MQQRLSKKLITDRQLNIYISRCLYSENVKLKETFSQRSVGGAGVKVFDRNLKKLQRDRAADRFGEYDYLKSEVAYRLVDRIYDVKRFFDTAVDFGCGSGLMAPHIFKVLTSLDHF